MTATIRCPSCRKPVPADPGERPEAFPFCSRRCRLVDLDHWLQGDYRIPVVENPAAPPNLEES